MGNHQIIRDRLESLDKALAEGVIHARERLRAEQRGERGDLQRQCGAMGHVFTRHPYYPSSPRTCAVCACVEQLQEQVVATNLQKGA